MLVYLECVLFMIVISVLIGLFGNRQWAMVNGQWAMGNRQWSMVNGQWSMVNGQWAMGNRQWAMGNQCRLVKLQLFVIHRRGLFFNFISGEFSFRSDYICGGFENIIKGLNGCRHFFKKV
jgi:hypothetical protein